ncbi:MAG: hypothetical protein HY072_08835, partial [Deltaproteobacteria bacterium]|nr:hypothetical protein [Deltaproteobacteria bacterium]
SNIKDEVVQSASDYTDEEETDVQCLVDPIALKDLKKKEKDLVQKEKDLVAKEIELVAAKKAFEQEFVKIKTLRDEITKSQVFNKQGNEEKIAKLVETIETMNPKSATKLLQTVDEYLAVVAMNKISTQKLAKILNIMEPEYSSKLTEHMMGIIKARVQAQKGGEENHGNTPTGSNAPGETTENQPKTELKKI